MMRDGPKGPDGWGLLDPKEENMKLTTRFEAAKLSDDQLRSLLRETFNALAASDADSAERRNALATLETVQTELASRSP
jgi:hypothetical protein